MLFLENFMLASESDEIGFIRDERRTCFSTMYPFNVFPIKGLNRLDFAPVTIFYGGNGSGKTTLLNIIAEKCGVIRHSEFNSSAFFNKYISYCTDSDAQIPETSQFLSSDDVFDYVMNIRYLNKDIDSHREDLFKGYALIREKARNEEGYTKLHGLEDYDRWKEVRSAYSRKSNQSSFVKERLARNIDMFSNGETSMRYFTEHIDRDALYLLDEPENSLSIKFQLDLAKYITDSARFYNCQFIIATHSPVFLSIKDAKIYNLDKTPVSVCKWTELENVRAYYEFFKEHENEFI